MAKIGDLISKWETVLKRKCTPLFWKVQMKVNDDWTYFLHLKT